MEPDFQIKQHPANGRWYARVTDGDGYVSTDNFRTKAEAGEWAYAEFNRLKHEIEGRDLVWDDTDD